MVVRLIDEPKKAPLEKAVQAKIIKFLKTFRKWSGDAITKNMYGSNGIADIVGCYDGKYVCIEVKRDHNVDVTPTQRLWLKEKYEHGAIMGKAYSIETVKGIFNSFKINLDNEPRK